MSVSSQIIEVLDDLSRRFGVAVDWSSENIMPYLKDLCGRYINYEIYTSIAWCAIFVIAVLGALIVCTISKVVYTKTQSSFARDAMEISMLIALVGLCVGIIVWCCQTFDIIECVTIPEKVILEYINVLIRTSGR